MGNIGKIIFDIIVILSVAACIVYIISMQKRNAQRRAGRVKGMFIDKCIACVKYNSEELTVCLNFYTDGIVLEKENSEKMFIPSYAIKSVENLEAEGESFVYRFEFEPEADKIDSFDIISKDDITKFFSYVLNGSEN